MISPNKIKFLWLACLLLAGSSILPAQQRGQWLTGQQELDGGRVPDPGFSYANLTFNYSAPELNSSLKGNTSFWANENVFFFVPEHKVLGGYYAPFVITIGVSTSVDAYLGVTNVLKGGGAGLTDLVVQPVHLGWRFKRADVNAGYGFVAPMGRFVAGATNNVGCGYWGNYITSGVALYLTKDKKTSAHVFNVWETHGQIDGTHITPGQALSTDWGIGRIIPLRKDQTRLVQLGLIGYDQWQLTSNTGTAPTPFYSVHAMGFESDYILPVKALKFVFKYENEYTAQARPQGRLISFGGIWTLRIPGRPHAKP